MHITLRARTMRQSLVLIISLVCLQLGVVFAQKPPAPPPAPEIPPQPYYAAAYKVPHDPVTSWEQPGPSHPRSDTTEPLTVPEIVDDRETDDSRVEDMVLGVMATSAP